jgi:NTP pyrophosphatase (non-canonical NTP hydrolase)
MIYETNGIAAAIAMHKHVHGDGHIERCLNQLVEESAELIHAVQRFRRCRTLDEQMEQLERIQAEMADVILCAEFLGQGWNITPESMRKRINGLAVTLNIKLHAWDAERHRRKQAGLGVPPLP